MLENDVMQDEEGRCLREEAKSLAKAVDPELLKTMDRDEIDYPVEFIQMASNRDLLGVRFPEKWGGRECSWLAETVALEEIGVLGSSIGCAYAMPSIVGEAIERFGTQDQKERYLKPMLRGEKIAAEGLTEPRGGSDFFGTATTAKKKDDYYILNGQKRFIAGGKTADFFLLYTRTDPDASDGEALSAFLVDRNEGIRCEQEYGLLGFRGMGTSRVVLRDVKVPTENLLGEEHGGKSVFNYMMVPERMTSSAGAIGTARAALEIAMDYSTKRKAFGQRIKNFEGVNFKVAECISELDAARALTQTAAEAAEQGRDARKLVSEAKRFATDVAWETVNHAMQILGGIGYTKVFPVERMLRDLRLSPIWTGSNEIMNLLIQHEAYKDFEKERLNERDLEKDAMDADQAAEKVYDLDDQRDLFET